MSAGTDRLTLRPEPSGFGAELTGLDLRAPLDPGLRDELLRAWAEHSVIWLPDQPLGIEGLEALTRALGEFGEDPFIEAMPGHPHVLELRREPDERAMNFGAGWHSDWSFQPAPPAGTLLHAEVVPPVGGDTLYADCTRAYEALSDGMQTLLAPLRGVHSALLPYSTRGVFANEQEARTMKILVSEEAEKTQAHPLVRTHPVTGRKAIFASPVYTIGIEGLEQREGRAILTFLFEHMVQDDFVLRHRWREQMLTIWDNRCTMHFAEGGYDGHRRVMHRTTLAGDTPV